MKLDKKDKKILKELMLNSRIPITRLARKVGVSREVALYRIKKLKKEVIKEFYTIMDIRKLGFQRHVCFVQLRNVTAEEEVEFIKDLVANEYVTYLGPTIGRWNVVFDILSRDDEHLKQVITMITKGASNKIDNYIIAGTLMKEEIFPTKIVGVPQYTRHKTSIEVKDLKIDKTDKMILELLSNNPRLEYTEISQKLKMTANSIRYRIRNMEKAGIIQGYSISVDMKKLGLDLYNLQFKITDLSKFKDLILFLRHHPKAMYYFQYFGHENWDLDVGMIVEDSMELREFILEIRRNFSDTVKLFDLYIVTEVTKENYPSKKLLRNL